VAGHQRNREDAIERRANGGKGSRRLPPAVYGFLIQLSVRMTDQFLRPAVQAALTVIASVR
jgi:hypothetical protein